MLFLGLKINHKWLITNIMPLTFIGKTTVQYFNILIF
jgi:hypothetical protein